LEKQITVEELFEHNENNAIKFPIAQLVSNRIKITDKNIYTKILMQLVKSDTAKINYNKQGTRGFKLQQISNIFSGNILLAALVPIYLIVTSKDGAK